MIQKLRRLTTLLLALVLLCTVLAGVVKPNHALAAELQTAQSTIVNGKVLDHQLYFFLVSCFANVNMDNVPRDQVYSYEWFKNTDMASVRGAMYENQYVECDDGDYIKEGLERFGLAGDNAKTLDTFCSLDFTFNKAHKDQNSAHDKKDCIDSVNLEEFDGADGSNAFNTQKAAITKLLDSTPKGSTAKGGLSDAEEYIRKYRTLVNGCHIKLQSVITPAQLSGGNNPADGESRLFDIPTVLSDGSIIHVLGASGESGGVEFDNNSKVYLVANTKTDESLAQRGTQITCGQLAKDLRANDNKLPKAYAEYVKKAAAGDVTSAGNLGTEDPTCESEGGPLGWILCSALRLVDGMLSSLDEGISSLLFVDSSYYSTDNLGDSWKAMRNIAYLILIPMMLLMVIGTAIGVGPFDAYTVKKSLPRMLAAIIFISLSLPITQLGVQVSNSVGNGVGNFITSTVPPEKQINSLEDIFAKNESTTGDSIVTGFTGLVILGAGLTVGLTLFSFAAVAAVALLIGFAILVMRQVLIVTLIVVAPLAILVWIFPGNDKLWIMWKTTFIAMLMMYPLISILIASGKFVAGIAG